MFIVKCLEAPKLAARGQERNVMMNSKETRCCAEQGTDSATPVGWALRRVEPLAILHYEG